MVKISGAILNLTRVISVILLFSIIFSFVTVLVFPQRFRGFSVAAPVVPQNTQRIQLPLVFGVVLLDKPPPINQSVRTEIYDAVKSNPGIHFRGICSYLGIPVGVAQYHLDFLTKAGFISFLREGRYKRYFSEKIERGESMIISILRHKTAGRILLKLSERPQISHKNLALELEISSQALTWQMSRLKEMRLVNSRAEGMKIMYSLKEENATSIKLCLDIISNTQSF